MNARPSDQLISKLMAARHQRSRWFGKAINDAGIAYDGAEYWAFEERGGQKHSGNCRASRPHA